MKYTAFQKETMSVFSLGTVQLGMTYGLGEHNGKPTQEMAFSVLDSALRGGVNVLDTANNYGDSEAIIGQWLGTVKEEDRPLIVTKIGPFDHSSPEALRADIRAQTETCRKTLGISVIDILMVHSFADYEKDPEIVSEVFASLKRDGIIRYRALSLYSDDDYFAAAKSGFDAVQIPLNVFDFRHIKDGSIQAIADAGIAIFARSVFLQGLVFFTPEEVDPRMEFARPYVAAFRELCQEFDLTPAVLAISYVLSIPGVSSLVLGCQIPAQVEDNCAMMEKVRPLTDTEIDKLREAFADADPRLTDPRQWFNRF